MQRELESIIKNLDGKVLSINITDKMAELIDKNKNIIQCYRMDSKAGIGKGKKGKTIKIKKIRKKFKKKNIDYIICDYDGIRKYLNTFVKDSIYINNKKIYFYGNVDIELIKNKYDRYDTEIIINKYKNGFIICIDSSKAKNKYFKDLYYRIIDVTNDIIDYIGNILMG